MFKTDLITKRVIWKDHCWTVEQPLIWEDDKYEIRVLQGFDFDFASIPTIITNILPKNGQEYDRAACLHDALYSCHWLPKNVCDEIFYNAMIADGVSKVKARSMYLAVKWFGGSAYKNNNENEVQYYKNLVIVGVKND